MKLLKTYLWKINSLKIRNKIILGFSVVAFLGWLLGGLGLYGIQRLDQMANRQDSLQSGRIAISQILDSHQNWRLQLTLATSSGVPYTNTEDEENCALDHWLESYGTSMDDPIMQIILGVLAERNVEQNIHDDAAAINDYIIKGNQEAAWEFLEKNVLPHSTEIIELLENVESRYDEIQANEIKALHQFKVRISFVMGLFFMITVIASVIFAAFIIQSIMQPLSRLLDGAGKLALGDLSFEYDYHVDDQIGQLVQAFDTLTETMGLQAAVLDRLAEGDYTGRVSVRANGDSVNIAINTLANETSAMLGNVRQASSEVMAAAHQMSATSQSLSTGCTEQAAAIEEFSVMLGKVQEDVVANNHLAAGTLGDMQHLSLLMEENRGSMNEMLQSMEQIDISANEINTINKVINDIAFQTNILALNAAVEAARVGQQSKGITVVANEVRILANKCARAANETAELIKKSLENVQQGIVIVDEVNGRVAKTHALVKKNSDALGLISQATDRQQMAIDELNNGMQQISKVVQANSATAEESAMAANSLSAQANALDASMKHFVLNEKKWTGAGFSNRA